MEILKDKDISELRLVNDEDEKVKIAFQDKFFFLQAKKMIFLLKGYHYKWFWIV